MKLEIRRARPLKGEIRLSPDRKQSFSATLLALLAPGRTLLRGWQSTPEWEHLRLWLDTLGATLDMDPEGLVLTPPTDLREKTEFVLDAFLPLPFAAGFMALAAGFSHEEHAVTVVASPTMAALLSPVREALREAGWVAPAREENGSIRWTWKGRMPPLRESVCRTAVTRMTWTLAALASGQSLEFQEAPDLPDPLDDCLGMFGLQIETIKVELSAEEEEMRRRMQRMRGKEPKRLVQRRVPAVSQLSPADIRLSGDLDLAGWCAVTACLRRGTDLTLLDVLLAPSRSGLFNSLRRMGGDVEIVRRSESRGVVSGDLRLRHGRMVGRKFDGADIAGLSNYACLLSAAAVLAEAETVLGGLGDLRIEGQDDLGALAEGLRSFGVAVGLYPDGLVLRGEEQPGSEYASAQGRENVALALHALASSTAGKTELDQVDSLPILWPSLLRNLAGESE